MNHKWGATGKRARLCHRMGVLIRRRRGDGDGSKGSRDCLNDGGR
jgi:hypothetical protein